MDIPAIYAVFRAGAVWTAPVSMDGASISFVSEPSASEYSSADKDERMPLVVADVRGLGKDQMDDRLLTNMKFPGSDVWFLTHIEDIEDVFDSFMGEVSKVLIPYHTVRNDRVLEEAYDVSDNCIPILFVSQGKAVCRGGQTKDVRDVVEIIERIGFPETAVLDTDGSVPIEEWSSLGRRFDGLIPYVQNKSRELEEIGFRNIISDL